MKFQADISFRNIKVAKFQCPKFTKRAKTQKYHMNCFQFFTKYLIYHPLSADTSFKSLALILFEILHLQNFIPCFSKGRTFTRGDNLRKNTCLQFFHEESIHEILRRYLDATYIHTYIHSYIREDNPKRVFSPHFQSWGIKRKRKKERN